jgi:hypothetical protein
MSTVKLLPLLLLLGPFVAKNQAIYKDKPEMLAKFDGLTLEDLEIGAVTKANGIHSAHVQSSSRGFTSGPDQKWRPASVHSEKVLDLTVAEPLESKAAVEALTAPGVYAYLAEDGSMKHIVVIAAGTAAEIQAADASVALYAALRYDIPADQIALGDGVISVNGDTIVGDVEYVLAAVPVATLDDEEVLDL